MARRLTLWIGKAALALGCSEPAGIPAADAGCPERDLLAALSDYTTSYVGTVGPHDYEMNPGVDLGNDPALRVAGGKAFFINRFDGTLFTLDAACGRPDTRLLVSPPTRAWNPQDVACTDDRALWVPFYNAWDNVDGFRPELRVLPEGAQDGDPRVQDISLAEYDTDGNPNAASAIATRAGGVEKVFVSLGRLDDESKNEQLVPPKGPGLLVRFDAATRKVDATFELTGWNPFGQIERIGSLLLLAMAGNTQVGNEDNAGIEIYDPDANISRLIVTERELGGSVAQVAISGTCGAAIVFGPEPDVNPTELVTFVAPDSAATLGTAGTVIARKVLATPGFDLRGLAWRDDTLYVGDRRRLQAGYAIHKLERVGACELRSAGEIVVPQPPVALLPTVRP